MKRHFLKQKVAISLIIISTVSLVLISVVVFLFIHQTLIDNKKIENLAVTTEQTHESILTFKMNQLFVHMLSTRTRLKEFLSTRTEPRRVEILKIFSDYSNKESKYLAIYLLDKNGVGLISTDPRFVGQNYSFRDYFKKALNGQPSMDVAIGVTSNQLGYYFAEPVFGDKGDILGVMVVKVDQSDISNPILTSIASQGNVTMLTDEFGVILASTEKDRNIKSLGKLSDKEMGQLKSSDRYLGKEIIPLQYDLIEQSIRDYKNPITVNITDKEDKDSEMISLIKLNDLPFYIVTEVRLVYLNNQVLNTIYYIILLVSLILILISLFIYFSIIIFIKPLDSFKLFFSNISKGDFSKKIDIKTKDEFVDLADNVNKMTEKLQELYTNMDKKVKEQTIKIENKVKDSENQNKAILNILEDVEESKKYSDSLAKDLEKFKLAVDNVSDQILITDVEGTVVYGNRAVEKITGFKPEEVLGKKVGLLWKTPMQIEYYQNLWDIIKNKKKTFIGEIQNKRKNGEIYTAMISISLVFDNNGDVLYYVAIERDITKEKEVDKAKTEFVSLASHQLRTPLSAINWYTEMLLAGDAGVINEDQKKYLEEIAVGNKRMVDLVDDLLNVSRLDMGTFMLETKEIDVLTLLKSVLGENKPIILEKKLVVEEHYSQDIPSMFFADEKLLRMVFQNILSNAVKYTQPLGLIKINLLKINKGEIFGEKVIEEESLAFSISDSGMGIPSNQQDKIFGKLFRADNAKESETEGTGLGLYVIKSIIDLSGGLIWFKSEENKGTTFWVVFPIGGMKEKAKQVV